MILTSVFNATESAYRSTIQGVKLFFFFFLIATWLLNSSKWYPIQKKLVAIFKDKQNLFFYAVIVLEIKLGKRSLTCYKVDTRMDDIQRSSAPKSKMASSHRSRYMCCISETNLTRKFASEFFFANLFNSLYL